MLNIKHLKTLLIFWILIMQYCVFTETLMAKKYSPINRCRDAWCWHEDRIKRQKLIELAQRKRGIHKKRDPLQLKIRAFQGGLVSIFSNGKSINRLALEKLGNRTDPVKLSDRRTVWDKIRIHDPNNDLLYTFGRDFNFTLGISHRNRGKAKVQFLEQPINVNGRISSFHLEAQFRYQYMTWNVRAR